MKKKNLQDLYTKLQLLYQHFANNLKNFQVCIKSLPGRIQCTITANEILGLSLAKSD